MHPDLGWTDIRTHPLVENAQRVEGAGIDTDSGMSTLMKELHGPGWRKPRRRTY